MQFLIGRFDVRTAVAVAICLAGVAVPRFARAADPSGTSREELVRKWDLNSDGTIDDGEAEVARSKMRRERADLQMKSGIDPLTGRPRSVAADDTDSDKEGAADLPAAESPRTKPDAALPGTRVPDVAPPIPAARSPAAATRPGAARPSTGRESQSAQGGSPPAGPRSPASSARGTDQPGATGPAVVTGGARAGAPARPGYGARLPRPDMNAGRLPASQQGQRPASGGLLPNLRRPSAAPGTPAAPPRRTVDDYDVY
jgi:hypothetical protein